MLTPKVEKRFLKAVRSSGLVSEEDLLRAMDVQRAAAQRGRQLPLDRILLKLELLDRPQILGLWRALRYYVWRKEDKLYVKVAIQSAILTEELGEQCLREQKTAYKHDNVLVRVNEIARQRGYLRAAEDRALIRALHQKHEELTLQPVDDETAAKPYERRSTAAATEEDGEEWKSSARLQDLSALRDFVTNSGEGHGISDDDLDALWDEADLDDIELDSQAVEIANAPLFEDDDDEDLF
ncbi:MAG TPA: hypothetical protein DEA08_18200 [Planctomycetes bacterium]|nr:hypothetical protein [Planctomycetota bacterium]